MRNEATWKEQGIGPGCTAAFVGAAILSEKAWLEVARSLKLSVREIEIIRGIFDNLPEKAVGVKLQISEHTVHTHLRRLFVKLAVTTRTQLALRITQELLALTLAEKGALPPICRNRCAGRCQLTRESNSAPARMQRP